MIAIAGGKGGCGKTTTALGLAGALARDGRRPLVVDTDCDMPNLQTMAETDRRPGLETVDSGGSIAVATHRSPIVPGVDVLPAGDASGPISRTALQRLDRCRQPVVLDCPAGATDTAAAPLRRADEAVVVTTPDRASRSDAVKTARMADALDASVLGSVVTRAESRSPSVACDGGSVLDPVLAAVPKVDGSVLGSEIGRASYDRLATALSGRNI